MSPITKRIIAALANGPKSAVELAPIVHSEISNVRGCLKALKHQGVVEPRGLKRSGSVGHPAKLVGLVGWITANREVQP